MRPNPPNRTRGSFGRPTTFLTTHSIEEAERLCGRIAFLVKGRIVRIDTVDDLVQPIQDTHVLQLSVSRADPELYPHMSVGPDWPLGILFGMGGMAGMYLGARCQKFMPASAIKWMLAGVIVFTALKYAAAFFGW